MFPFHGRADLSFQVPNDYDQRSDYTNHRAQLASNFNLRSQNTRKECPQRSLINTEVNANKNEIEISGNEYDHCAKKRIIHREIERQRRQEMSKLYSSIRSLLPTEYVRGKRSISDHITEAARYIKDLEKNVKELGDKRDKLKESSSKSQNQSCRDHIGCSSSSTTCSKITDYNVSIHTFSKAIEIEIISAGVGEENVFPLSRLLKVLIEEEINVVSCASSKVNQRWIYVIHCEVNDITSIDSHRLKWRLTSEICSYNS